MLILFRLFAGYALIVGGLTLHKSTTAMHEIEALLWWLIFAIFLSASEIGRLIQGKREPKDSPVEEGIKYLAG